MKTQNITPEQITNELFNIFSDDRRESQYMNERGEMYAGIIGWAGVMSPENRPAFIKTFGAAVVLQCEQEARARVAEYRAAVDRSTYHRNEMAADAFELSDEVPAVGSFVWGRWSCLKGEGGPLGELEDLERMAKDGDAIGRRLCEVVAVVDASPADFLDRESCNRIARRFKIYGGSRYDEQDPQSLDGFPLTWELVFCVRCAGRWFLIDGQGYDYTRYFLMPDSYGRMFAPEGGRRACRRTGRKRGTTRPISGTLRAMVGPSGRGGTITGGREVRAAWFGCPEEGTPRPASCAKKKHPNHVPRRLPWR